MSTPAPPANVPARAADRELVESVLAEVGHGFLAIVTADGRPSAVPLNFVWLDGRVYFHGASEGEKMEAIAREPRVSFTIVDAGALIPSYFRHPRSACPATQYYRSVMVRGRARVVTDVEEKARALQALMEKLQPEGGHEAITAEAALYRKALRTTSVTAIEVECMSGKFKLGQNLSDRVRETVIRGLEERGGPGDSETAERMRKAVDLPVTSLVEVR